MELLYGWLGITGLIGLGIFAGAGGAGAWLGATAGLVMFLGSMALMIALLIRDERRKKKGITY